MSQLRFGARSLAITIAIAIVLFHASISSAGDQSGSSSSHAGDGPQKSRFVHNQYLVSQQQFTLPFYLFNGHMLIDGAVNGRSGKFLFDTGTEFPFFLNNQFLSLSKDSLVGRGYTGSGQEMVLYRQEAPVLAVEIAHQIRFENMPGQIHTDWGFLAQAYSIPSFLGSIGYGFNQNYLFVIDYDAQTIVFHAQNEDENVLARVIDPARVVTTFKFIPTGVDGKMPEVELRVGNEVITAFFDTGNQGSLELTEETRNSLQTHGYLSLFPSEYAYGAREPNTRAILTGLSYRTDFLHDARNLSFKTWTKNRLGLGFNFMKNYVTVWDYKRQVLTLLRP